MSMKRISLALLVFAGGCTPMQWARPDSPPAEQIQADLQHCQAVAWSEARRSTIGTFASYGWMYRDPLGRRFIGYPYSPLDPLGERDMDELRLTNFCMRSKGYELTPAPKS